MSNQSFYPDSGPAPASQGAPGDMSQQDPNADPNAPMMGLGDLPIGIIPRLLALRDDIVELLVLLGIDDSMTGDQTDMSQDPNAPPTDQPVDQLGPYSDVPDAQTQNTPSARVKSLIAKLQQ